tara:strand:- start:196 stop:492 length:297 start_codon:yes stop_codon:yes gene_type:complete
LKLKQVKFKGNAPCGYDGYGRIEDIAEKRLENFQKSGQYDIEVVGEIEWKGNHNEFPPTNNKPTTDNTVKEIKEWLTNNNIEFTGSHDTKAKLLALIP